MQGKQKPAHAINLRNILGCHSPGLSPGFELSASKVLYGSFIHGRAIYVHVHVGATLKKEVWGHVPIENAQNSRL